MLGVFEDATFPSDTLELAPGDSLIFYSDGVTDALAPDGRELGLDRLIAAIAAHATARPTALVSGVLSVVRQFVGSAASVDDATIAVLKVR